MPRRRPKRARARRAARAAPRTKSAARRTTPAPSEAETLLLALARELAALPADAEPGSALRLLAGAHAPEAPLPRAVARAWIRGHEDKTAALALAWAREQVRLTLEEILARTPPRGALGGAVATRAWVVLAAAESIAHEPPAAAADRLRTLLELLEG